MRIVVVVAHEDQLSTAGVRIRYDRIQPHLAAAGHRIDLRVIDSIQPDELAEADTYLFCKCHDTRSVLLAEAVQAAGKRVGVDLFDDYFSMADDSRFAHLRRWLRAFALHADFAFCSTPAMQARLRDLLPGLPLHMLSDPFEPFDAAALGRRIEEKARAARAGRSLEIGWFGIGDNPHFSVGLEDLAAFGDALARVRARGFHARLNVVTNPRALDQRRLEYLARLPLEVRIADWSLPAERALVEQSLLCVLPVNAQPFSTVKSLNRGITALTGGAQVLSLGHPLYAALEDFVYRDLDLLLADLDRGRLRLRAETLPALAAALTALCDPARQAAEVVAFLQALHPVPRGMPPARTAIVLHGMASSGAVHQFARRFGMFVAASPLTDKPFVCDLRVQRRAGERGAVLVLSGRAAALLAPESRARLLPHPVPDEPGQMLLPLPDRYLAGLDAVLVTEKLAAHAGIIAAMTDLLHDLFPAAQVLLSDDTSAFVAAPGPAAAVQGVRHG